MGCSAFDADPSILEVLESTGSPMQFAVSSGDLSLVKQMLELGVPLDDVNEFGMRPIAYAAGLGNHANALQLMAFFLDNEVVADCFSSHRWVQ